MPLFEYNELESIVSTSLPEKPSKPLIATRGDSILDEDEDDGLTLIDNSGRPMRAAAKELEDQFVVFQISNTLEAPSIFESSKITPALKGSEETPDVLVQMQMQSFNLGANENIDPNTRATMRITMGKDENSSDKFFDTVYWSIAAGLNLYDESKKAPVNGAQLKSDFRQAFGHRPIEIPGGLSKLSFEVVKHKEPAWWRKAFSFFKSPTGSALTSALGFPAVTLKTIHMVDTMLERLADTDHEVLFKSVPMKLALTQQAKTEYTGGNARVRLGSLAPGFCILARARDYKHFVESDYLYYPTYGKLIPQNVSDLELTTGEFEDPLRDVTYAVFKIGMKETLLQHRF